MDVSTYQHSHSLAFCQAPAGGTALEIKAVTHLNLFCYTCGVEFDWDPKKAALNLKRHGVSFREATTFSAIHYPSQHLILIIPQKKIAPSLSVSHIVAGC